jgi:hypothetical protein
MTNIRFAEFKHNQLSGGGGFTDQPGNSNPFNNSLGGLNDERDLAGGGGYKGGDGLVRGNGSGSTLVPSL